MDLIREAFQHIKQDIIELKEEVLNLNNEINLLKQLRSIQTAPAQTPTQNPQIQTFPLTPTQTPTQNPSLETPLTQNMPLSIGNEGVPTDKPTDRQTNQQTGIYTQNSPISDFQQIQEALDSLDSAKKAIRLKFKRLTPQEMLVFSTLYGFQEQNIEEITYKSLANHLKLSESSIRDYINKLIIKGIPMLKIRQNNKKITLQVSPDLEKVASLGTIVQLREL